MKIPKYIVIRIDTKDKGTTAVFTDISDRCEVIEHEAEQTEPNCSEKPNNCEDEPKDEPTGYNLTPVEDEPQTDCAWK